MTSRLACCCLLASIGCASPASLEPPACTGAACVGLAFATLARPEPPQPEPTKCCNRCGKNGMPPGKVRSGDGVAIIDCGCPAGCECKKPRAAACQNGKCSLK